MKCQVTSLDNKNVGEIDLADEVFGLPVRKDILARAVNWQLNKRRAGHAQDQGHQRYPGHDQEAVESEGHRPCPPGQPAFAAVPRRRPHLRSGGAQP